MLLWPGSLGVGGKCSETRPSISSSFAVVPETFYWACVSSLQDKEPHRTASCHPQSSVFIFSKSHYWHLRCFLSKVELELWQRNLCMKNLLNPAAARFIWQMCYPLSSPTGLCSHSKVRKKNGAINTMDRTKDTHKCKQDHCLINLWAPPGKGSDNSLLVLEST